MNPRLNAYAMAIWNAKITFMYKLQYRQGTTIVLLSTSLPKKNRKALAGDTMSRRHRRRSSLQLPKGVRVSNKL